MREKTQVVRLVIGQMPGQQRFVGECFSRMSIATYATLVNLFSFQGIQRNRARRRQIQPDDPISTTPRDMSILDAIAVAVASVALAILSAVKVARDQFQFPDC
jgi:hypothetical protein